MKLSFIMILSLLILQCPGQEGFKKQSGDKQPDAYINPKSYENNEAPHK